MERTAQEIFDLVVAHARTQKVQCKDAEGNCMYRGLDGMKCFIGALIPDENYCPAFEGVGVSPDDILSEKIRAAAGIPDQLREFAGRCQEIHDVRFHSRWESDFQDLAFEYGLTYEAP